ncbi:MAG TPA: CARDB domain-containing protein [Candidatus Methylomirabilis sp.]|nr:CARDB domain-containing protein [Candidatus Methylomirabilis sp.]
MSTKASVYRMRPVLITVLLTLVAGAIWAAPAAAAPLPDLVISHAKVAMKCNADGTRTANIFAIVKNQGQGTADLSKDPWHIVLTATHWYLNAEPEGKNLSVKPSAGGPKALKPGGIFPATLTITGIKPPPNAKKEGYEGYGFQVVADPGKIVAEANENNNKKLLYVYLDKNCQH